MKVIKITTQLVVAWCILPDEIHFDVEIQEQHDKKNQISLHHSHDHIHSQPERICSKEYWFVKLSTIYETFENVQVSLISMFIKSKTAVTLNKRKNTTTD